MSGNGSLVKTIEIKDRQGRIIATEDVVTYAGLLSLAHDKGLKKMETALVQLPEEANGHTAVFLAIVETESGTYKGHGDASPDNVASRIIPHIIRMAETRAKARALRDAVNIGVVSIEELALEGNGHSGNGNDGNPQSIPGSHKIPGMRSRSSPKADSNPASDTDATMTVAQRRYLFRLLAERKIEGDEVQQYLLNKAQVESLDQITKSKASILIDEMVNAAKPAEEIPF